MKQLTLPEMHQLLLRMLECIHEYCIANNIRYSLGGGTLLGAIRHKGFIPWDDDVDIMMPRPDYERFLEGFQGKYEHYVLQHWKNDKDYPLLYAKVYDNRTCLVGGKYIKGIYVDVFPIDGLPPVRKQKVYWCWYRISSLFERIPMMSFGRMSWKQKMFTVITYPIWRFIPTYKFMGCTEKYLLKYPFESSEHAGCTLGNYGMAEFMVSDTFKKYIDVNFERLRLKAIAAYDEYLTKHYGDYMQLPPVEKRKPQHHFTCCWKDTCNHGDQRNKNGV